MPNHPLQKIKALQPLLECIDFRSLCILDWRVSNGWWKYKLKETVRSTWSLQRLNTRKTMMKMFCFGENEVYRYLFLYMFDYRTDVSVFLSQQCCSSSTTSFCICLCNAAVPELLANKDILAKYEEHGQWKNACTRVNCFIICIPACRNKTNYIFIIFPMYRILLL